MELFCTNTVRGLVPNYDSDFDEKKKLKVGETYKCKVTLARNYQFHKKYFALINCAWQYQSEKRQSELFKTSIEVFRKTVEIAAGHCDVVWNIRLQSFTEIPKTIAFDRMDNTEFEDLYKRVRDVLLSTFLTHISEEEFMNNLIHF